MLLELLDAEFPDYTPRILLHANCTGPFLNDRRMAGVIYSSTTQLVREMCDVLIDRIENPGAPLEEVEILDAGNEVMAGRYLVPSAGVETHGVVKDTIHIEQDRFRIKTRL